MNPILFSGIRKYLGGKTHFPLELPFYIDEATLLSSPEKHKKMIIQSIRSKNTLHLKNTLHIEICENCLGTGEIVLKPTFTTPCFFCNGSGYLKKCACGSGIKIGTNEFFCTRCKPRPELDLRILLNRRRDEISSGMYFSPHLGMYKYY